MSNDPVALEVNIPIILLHTYRIARVPGLSWFCGRLIVFGVRFSQKAEVSLTELVVILHHKSETFKNSPRLKGAWLTNLVQLRISEGNLL